jgi:hypothetical protein
MKCLVLLVLASVLSTGCLAYETETHALMTNQAYAQSILSASGTTSTIHRLGLDRLDINTPFSIYWGAPPPIAGPDEYVDNITGQLYPPEEFERCNMQEFYNSDPQHPVVPPTFSQLFFSSSFEPTVEPPNSSPTIFPIRNWLVHGAVREDDLGVSTAFNYFSAHCNPLSVAPSTGSTVRVLNHFYDPINNTGLGACPPLLGPCQKSVDWAQGVVDSFTTPPAIDSNRRNHFSYEDARQAMWLALTQEIPATSTPSPTAGDRYNAAAYRLYQWATVFRDLGDVVHLLQDTAQPQHTRNDPHSFFQNSEQQAFEGFTNARVLGQTVGASGSYVRSFFGENLSTVIPPPPLGNYPAVTFATPLRFFTTRAAGDTSSTSPDNRYGLADYTNRGFFTGGTLPGSSTDPYAEPPQTLDNPDGYTAVSRSCFLPTPNLFPPAQAVTCAHYTRAVSDTVDSTYSSQDVLPAGFTQPPLVTQSVFAQPILSFAPGVNYISEDAVGIEELVTQANLTIPRAIGYSTGMINYFFRGQLSVTAPSDGIYAMVNHGTPHTVNAQGYPCQGTSTADGCPVFGFEQVRLNVQNTTPAVNESGTGNPISTATGGTGAQLVAVARYHRNPCYTTDLTGEYTHDVNNVIYPPANCTNGDVRTPYQEISVSAPIAVTPGMLDGTQPVALTFDFSADPIPINATDLFLQAVYRGPLGDEPDGIAVGTVDVSEPTYVALFNGTDYVSKNNQWVIPSGTDPMPQVFTSIQICDGATQIYAGSAPGLPITHVLRLAMLRDFTNPTFSAAVSMANGVAFGTYQGSWYGRVVQADDEKGDNLHVGTLYFARGEVLGYHNLYYYQYVPPLPNPELDWSGLPTPSTAVSENLGAVVVPGTTACPF